MNPYASPFRCAIIRAFLRVSSQGARYHPARAARIAARWGKLLKLAAYCYYDGSPVIGSWWRRKSSGYLWRAMSTHYNSALVRVELMKLGRTTREEELLTPEDFFERFEPA